MTEATTQASVTASVLQGLDIDQAVVVEVQGRVQHLLTRPAELVARRQDLERRTFRTMAPAERLEYRLLSLTREVVPVTPPGQQVKEEFQVRDDAGRVPYIGLMVAYWPRSGEGRSNKPWFPALVADVRTHNVLLVTVFYDPQEIRDVAAPRRSPDNMRGSWDYLADDPYWEIVELKARIASLEAVIKNGRK